MPYGFDLNNSPAAIAQLSDVTRPMILLTTSGTELIHMATGADAVYAACLRNVSAQAAHLVQSHERVGIIEPARVVGSVKKTSSGVRGSPSKLLSAGYEAANEWTTTLVSRWSGAPVQAIETSESAEYLRRSRPAPRPRLRPCPRRRPRRCLPAR